MGFKLISSIRIATNSEFYHNIMADMDVNAGVILRGTSLDEVREEILDMIIEVAPGRKDQKRNA